MMGDDTINGVMQKVNCQQRATLTNSLSQSFEVHTSYKFWLNKSGGSINWTSRWIASDNEKILLAKTNDHDHTSKYHIPCQRALNCRSSGQTFKYIFSKVEG